jgi:molybdate transport repressor ModE-like protein
MSKPVYALILADDTRPEGTQFGSPSETGGSSPIRKITHLFREAGIENVVIVSTSDSKLIRQRHRQDYLEFALGEHYLEQIQRISAKASRIFLLPVCYSGVSGETIDKMLNVKTRGIIAPANKGELGFPLLIPPEILPKIANLTIPNKFENFINTRRAKITEIETADKGVVSQSVWCEEISPIVQVNSLVTITKGGGVFSPDTLKLLQMIDEVQSVKRACVYMGISYSLGWMLLERAEEVLGYSLIWKQQGGKQGGSSQLTLQTEAFVEKYEAFIKEIEAVTNAKFNEYFGTEFSD